MSRALDIARTIAALGVLPILVANPVVAQGANGLSTVGAQRFILTDLPRSASDLFGVALAVADFNGDGIDDLATGAPGQNGPTSGVADAGAVVVRNGAGGVGLSASSFQSLFQAGSPDPPEAGDRFGTSLAACDFDGDGFDDLAVGVPLEDVIASNAGAVQVHYGAPAGLPINDSMFFTQASAGVPDGPEQDDFFGSALACGDFDGDGFADLAVGVPGEDIGALISAGLVHIIAGSESGLDPLDPGARLFTQSTSGGVALSNATFGSSLAAGDFDGDGRDDLAIGARGWQNSSGLVRVARGVAAGLACCSSFVQGDLPGGVAEVSDFFGSSFAVGDFDGDGFDDLAIGAPGEGFGPGTQGAGQVAVVEGSSAGLHLATGRFWAQEDLFGLPTSEALDQLGASLVALDFDADGFDDLAAGRPGEDVLVDGDGAVVWWMGSSAGLDAAGRHRDIQSGLAGFPGPPLQVGLFFGVALQSGDFDGDGFDDLVIGNPFEDESGVGDAGTTLVLYGSLFSDGFESANLRGWSSTARQESTW